MVEYNYIQTVTSDALNNVDEIHNLTITGNLIASSSTVSELFILENASITAGLSTGSLNVEGGSEFGGAMSGVSASFSNSITTDALIVNGLAVFSLPAVMSGAGIAQSTILASSIAPVVPRLLSITNGGFVQIDTLTDPVTEFSLELTGNVHALQFFNMALYNRFDIFVTNPSGIICTVDKQLSNGDVACYNTLAGNVNIAPGSLWCIKGKCVALNVVVLDFVNYT